MAGVMADAIQAVGEGMKKVKISHDKKPKVPPQDQAKPASPQNQVKLDEKKPEVDKKEHEKVAARNIVGIQPEAWEEKLAEALTFEMVDELSAMLDSDSTVVKNWYYLAILLGFTDADTNAMRRDGTGGGHHAKEFLISFQSDNVEETVADFLKKFGKMKRNDIKKFLENKDTISKDTKICELPLDVLDTLAEMLTCKGGVVKDWKYLASLCGYDHEQIQEIASMKAGDAQYSPTKALFYKMRTSKPDTKLGDLKKILGDQMSRWDVVRKLESFYDK